MRFFKHFLKHTFNIEMDVSEYGKTDLYEACQSPLTKFSPTHSFSDLRDGFDDNLFFKVMSTQAKLLGELVAFSGSVLERKKAQEGGAH